MERAEATTLQYQDATNQASSSLLKSQNDINRQFKSTSHLFPAVLSQRSENKAPSPEMSVDDSVRDSILSQDLISKKSETFGSGQESVISSERKIGIETPKTHTRKRYHKDNHVKRESFIKREKNCNKTNRQITRRRNVQKAKENDDEHHRKQTFGKNSKSRQ